jgi:hypothetical protein
MTPQIYKFTTPAIDLMTIRQAIDEAIKTPCLKISAAYTRDMALAKVTMEFTEELSSRELGIVHHILLIRDRPTIPHPNDDWI